MPYIGLYVLAFSIHSLFYVTTALLKSDVSGTENLCIIVYYSFIKIHL